MSKSKKSYDSLLSYTPKGYHCFICLHCLLDYKLFLHNLAERFPEILPSKGNTEISKTVFTHVSNLHRLLHDWVKMIDKGAKICTLISELKLHEYDDGYFPNQTKVLSERLVDALDGLKNVVDGVEILNNQLMALSQLQPDNTPVTQSWSVTKVSECVASLYSYIQREYKLKETITENIAHCRDENLMEVYVSSWKYDVYFKIDFSEYLFAEFGLPIII